MIFTRFGLLVVILAAASNAAAGSLEDEIIPKKLEVHAELHTYKGLKEWCEVKYPQTAALSERVGTYVYPRIEKVENFLFSEARNPEFKSFVNSKLKPAFVKGHERDLAHYESKYTEVMCMNVLSHILENGVGEKREAYILLN